MLLIKAIPGNLANVRIALLKNHPPAMFILRNIPLMTRSLMGPREYRRWPPAHKIIIIVRVKSLVYVIFHKQILKISIVFFEIIDPVIFSASPPPTTVPYVYS